MHRPRKAHLQTDPQVANDRIKAPIGIVEIASKIRDHVHDDGFQRGHRVDWVHALYGLQDTL
ncbi:hypothetical protein X740_31040 [Mesorhizobium sp. LNHC221B00]|nr:hypothetical protein X740_31040 [Mesorhizobium sp. LNHC221B00]